MVTNEAPDRHTTSTTPVSHGANIALTPYFLAAIGLHVRSKDAAIRYVPAVALLGVSVMAVRGFGRARPATSAPHPSA